MNLKNNISITSLTVIAILAGAFWLNLVAVSGDALAQGHTRFDSITSSQFILRDNYGKYRAEVLVDAHGRTLIVLADAQGRTALTIGVEQNGTAFIQDAMGRPFVTAQTKKSLNLPPIQSVSRPSFGGEQTIAADTIAEDQADSTIARKKFSLAHDAEVDYLRKQVDALWQQTQILQDRVNLISDSL
ncbi:MAG: hypothetical protein GY927_16615 [bacterium]|nr:hypothetical protein [bacterium]